MIQQMNSCVCAVCVRVLTTCSNHDLQESLNWEQCTSPNAGSALKQHPQQDDEVHQRRATSSGAAMHQHQQRDWDDLLADMLLSTLRQEDTQDTPSALPRALHRISRRHRDAARGALRHLNLSHYTHGRRRAQFLVAGRGPYPAPLVAAAGLPPIPWALLAATSSLTSLDMRASQVEELLAGSPGGAAPAAAAAAPAAAGGPPDVLSTTLSRLRRLCVSDTCSPALVHHLGRLLGATPHLTRLQLLRLDGIRVEDMDATPWLLAGLAGATPAHQAPTQQSPPAAPEAGQSAAAGQLPPLQHLDVYGMSRGLPDAWLALPQVAAQLTFLGLGGGAVLGGGLGALAACSSLRELVLRDYLGWRQGRLQLPEELRVLSALTRLVLRCCRLEEVPAVVWRLTALRHLNLADNDGFAEIPNDLSRLKQLTLLDLSDRGARQLPGKLGTWLPQLEVLQVAYTPLKAVPTGLTRLTRLDISSTGIRHLADLPADLGPLKQLLAHHSHLRPPLQGLSRFTALEVLHLGWQQEPTWDLSTPGCLPGPLPRLRSLNLCDAPPGLLSGLRGSMGVAGLTQLVVEGLEQQHLAALEQLGVLPRLQHLVLVGYRDVRWAAAAAWLHQQPSLTRLRLGNGDAEGQELQQLPEQLEELELACCDLPGGRLAPLTHLTRLRSLTASSLAHLLPWLPALVALEELDLGRCAVESGWGVLAQLPLLRRVTACRRWQAGACAAPPHAPHLCWAEPPGL